MRVSPFSQKVCLVTGGASGLGRELCEQLAALGGTVIVADINEDGARRVTAAIASTGGKSMPIRVDVADSESVGAVVQRAVTEFGRIDYLFNNAGIAGSPGEVRDLTLDDWRRPIEINLFGEIYFVHAVYPIMIRQGFGHIVNTASGFGLLPGPINTPYVASKFAIVGMTQALAIEARAFGVDVTLVCPGYVQTPLIDSLRPINADAKDFVAQFPFPPMPVDRAVVRILEGVARKRSAIVFPFPLSLLALVHRIAPRVATLIGLRQVAQFRKIRRNPD